LHPRFGKFVSLRNLWLLVFIHRLGKFTGHDRTFLDGRLDAILYRSLWVILI
jgi:hypothetical protein